MKRYLIGFLLILSCGTLTTSQSQVNQVVYYPNQESIVEVIQIVDEETGAVIAAKIVDYE
jgi:hypothetical protein